MLFNKNWSSRKTNVLSSNSWPFTSLKDLVMIQMVFLVSLLIRTWKRRSFITSGLLRIMELLIELWSVSPSPQKKWVKPHMPFSEDTTLPRLSEELRVLRLSRTSRTGLVPGLLRDKVCTTVKSQCNSQDKIPHIQLLLIPDPPNFLFHQMFLKRLDKSGNKLFLTLIALLIRPSAMLKTPAKILPQNLSQSDSKCLITFLKLTQSSTFTNHPTRNATSWSTNADSQERTRTFSL